MGTAGHSQLVAKVGTFTAASLLDWATEAVESVGCKTWISLQAIALAVVTVAIPSSWTAVDGSVINSFVTTATTAIAIMIVTAVATVIRSITTVAGFTH